MTNLFPKESLEHFLNGDYSEKIKTKVKRIQNAQKNYEVRDLIVSLYAKYNKEKIKKVDGKRIIEINGKKFPFKQSSPHVLVDLFIFCIKSQIEYKKQIVNGNEFDFNHYNFTKYDIHSQNYRKLFTYNLFFCSKEYTSKIGIKPHLIEDYKDCVDKYIEYIKWKVMK